MKNKRSLSYIIGVGLPAIIIIVINLYEILSQCSYKFFRVVTDILIIFMFFSIGLREIIMNKSKFGYIFLIVAIILLLVFYKQIGIK